MKKLLLIVLASLIVVFEVHAQFCASGNGTFISPNDPCLENGNLDLTVAVTRRDSINICAVLRSPNEQSQSRKAADVSCDECTANGIVLYPDNLTNSDFFYSYLGDDSKRWSNVYAYNVDAIRILPMSDDRFDLGSFSRRWDDVYATSGIVNTSDKRSKKNIKTLPYGLKDLMQLKPVSYQWKNRKDGETKLGLIAQDVQKVIKEVVKTHDYVEDLKTGERTLQENAQLGIYYTDLIPVLIKATQEQQEIIENKEDDIEKLRTEMEAQNTTIADLKTEVSDLKSLVEKLVDQKNQSLENMEYELELKSKATLGQNQPNPFHQNTQVEYFLPANVQQAKLQVTSVDGKVLAIFPIEKVGKGQVIIKAHAYPAGTYYYSLIVDGDILETKRMILTK